MTFFSDMRVLMGLISSTPQSLGVSLTLIIIYIKKNRCEMSETVFRYEVFFDFVRGIKVVRYGSMGQLGPRFLLNRLFKL